MRRGRTGRLIVRAALALLCAAGLPELAGATPARQGEPTTAATPTPAPSAIPQAPTASADASAAAQLATGAGASTAESPAGAGAESSAAAVATPPQSLQGATAPGALVGADAASGPGRVLYADNFASANSGWPLASSDPATRRVGYADGGYDVARLAGSAGSPYVMRAERFGDFLLEIDARLVEPTADAYVFVDFRRQDSGEHYSFVVAPDEGAFIVRRNTDREGTTLLDWTRTPAIQRGTAMNRLGIRAQGSEVTLLINGEEVARARADDPREGSIGFGVGSLGDGPAEARFGNLVVTSVE